MNEEEYLDESTYDMESKIIIKIDEYHDIFSSFDHRDWQEKNISSDFIRECTKYVLKLMSADSIGSNECSFMLPASFPRNTEVENKIIGRLNNYFKNKLDKIRRGRKIKILRSFVLFFIGVFFTLTYGYLEGMNSDKETATYWILTTIATMCQFAGWFLAWDNLSTIYYYFIDKKEAKLYKFFELASRLEFSFIFYN